MTETVKALRALLDVVEQARAVRDEIMQNRIEHGTDGEPLLRQWAALFDSLAKSRLDLDDIEKLVEHFEEAEAQAAQLREFTRHWRDVSDKAAADVDESLRSTHDEGSKHGYYEYGIAADLLEKLRLKRAK